MASCYWNMEYEVNLASGGTVRLRTHVDLLKATATDRAFLESLKAVMDRYEVPIPAKQEEEHTDDAG